MASDSDPMPLEGSSGSKRRRIVFDPTVNLGHLLTFAGMMAALGGLYMTVRNELTAHDVRITANERAADTEKERLRDDIRLIREDLREVRRNVEDLRRERSMSK